MRVSLAHCLHLILSSIIIIDLSLGNVQQNCHYHEELGRRVSERDGFLQPSSKEGVSSPTMVTNNNHRNLATSAIIDNNVVMLGVHDGGELNAYSYAHPDAHSSERTVGVRYYRDGGWYDSTAYGCKCEGE